MSVIEVSQDEYESLKRVQQMVDGLWNDPERGYKVKELVKEKYPQANIPELDSMKVAREAESKARSAVEEANKGLMERIERMEKEQQDRDEAYKLRQEEKKFETEVDKIKKKHSFTQEGMQKVFDRMKEKNNPDIESAAAWVLSQEPKQDPARDSLFSPSSMDLYGSTSGAKEWEDLNKAVLNNKVNDWFDRTAAQVLSEFN